MKKLLVLALVSTVLLIGCGKKEESASVAGGAVAKASVKLGNTNGPEDTQTMALFDVAKALSEQTNGNFSADVFPASALGGTDDMTEQAMQGASVVTISDPGRLASFVKAYGVIQMPYMLDDPRKLDKLIETTTYKKWEEEFTKHGLFLITSNWFSGSRNFAVNKVINTPADLKGQRVRTIGSAIFTDSVNAMGAVATPMPWSEVYPSIQQKALDGAEIQTVAAYAAQLWEVTKVINKTGHFQLIGSAVTGTKFYNSLTPEYQQLLVKTFRDTGTRYIEITLELSDKYEKEMATKHGATIHELDIAPFVKAVQPVYEKLGYTELRKQLLAELN